MAEKLFADSVMTRTYCRTLYDKGRKETPDEVFNRVLDSFEKYYVSGFPWLTDYYDRPKWLSLMQDGVAFPAGRMLWSMGSRSVETEGFLPMMNCSFIVIDSPVKPIRFILKMLILGCGVGFSLERKYMSRTQDIYGDTKSDIIGTLTHTADTDKDVYMVRDSKEGWMDFFEDLMINAILGRDMRFSTSFLRPKGSPIKGFGGTSGDPMKLVSTAKKIWNAITESSTATVTLYYDIICWIAELVISGNVRRSALIAIGDPDDEEFLRLKKFETIHRLGATQRYFCNNSVNVSEFGQLDYDYWDTYNAGTGEAYGWVNVQKSVTEEGMRYPPQGFNPCGEQPLHSREVCCLGEVNIEKIKSVEQFLLALVMPYLFCKLAYTLGAPTEPETAEICKHNQRIGVSLTGISMIDPGDFKHYAIKGRKFLRELDEEISSKLGVNRCVALTTVKPGGTLPKIAGSSGPGIHLPISEFQIRRVRFSNHCSLLPWLRECGVDVVPDLASPDDTSVASFYIRNSVPWSGNYSDHQVSFSGFKAMLRTVVDAQEYWSDNSVSVTIYYSPFWAPEIIRDMVGKFFGDLKCFSALPYFGHNFTQAPEEPVDMKTYFEKTARLKILPVPTTLDGIAVPEDFGGCGIGGTGCSDR